MNDTTTISHPVLGLESPFQGLLWFAKIAASLIYGLGFLGNIFAGIIFYYHDEFRRMSIGLLFLFITITNFFHLWTLVQEFLTFYNVILCFNVLLQCRLLFFVQNVSRAMSTYFMVTIAVDRLIRSELPVYSKYLCTRRNCCLIALVYLIVFSIFWSFYLYPIGSQDPITGLCSFPEDSSYTYFLDHLHAPIRAVLICFLPIWIMSWANIRMMINIRRSVRQVMDLATIISSSDSPPSSPTSALPMSSTFHRISSLDRMVFYMMITNISLFILTQFPFHLFMCLQSSISSFTDFNVRLIQAILLIWSSVYFGTAFYFHCLASSSFRQTFLAMVQSCPYRFKCTRSTGERVTVSG